MSLKCILQGQNDKSLKLDDSVLKQDNEDVTEKVKEIVKPTIEEIGAAAATHAAQHAAGGSDPITPEQIGAVSLSRYIANGDLNTCIISGFYRFDNPINGPDGFTCGQMIVAHGTGDTLLQIASDYSISRIAIRTAYGIGGAPKWNAWVNVATSADLAPILATSTPSRTVTVAAAELAAYLNALPRMVNEDLTISVTSGTVSETLMLNGFYGSGRLTIAQASGASVQCTKGIRIQYCTLRIRLYDLTVSGEGAAVGGFQELISIGPASCVYVDNCTLTGNGSSRGISASQGCIVEVAACTITHTDIALLLSKASVCAAYNCTASDNTTGAYVYYGGCIMLAGTTPELLGGSVNVKRGGIIAKANGTLL